jgi:hypothetical protein
VDEIAIFGAASESFSKYVIYAIKMIKFYAVLREIVEGICDSFRCNISFLYRLQVNNSDSQVINNIVLYLAEKNHTAYP